MGIPSAPDRLRSSSSLEVGEMKSSSESMSTLVVVVTGVGGAAGTAGAEAITFLFAVSSVRAEVIFASAAVRFLVMGGMVAV